MEQEHQFIDYIEQSIIKNWDKDALLNIINELMFLFHSIFAHLV